MIVYLAEYNPDPDDFYPQPLYTVGVYSTMELAEAAVTAELAKDDWSLGHPQAVISEWVLDETDTDYIHKVWRDGKLSTDM